MTLARARHIASATRIRPPAFIDPVVGEMAVNVAHRHAAHIVAAARRNSGGGALPRAALLRASVKARRQA